MRTNLTIPVVDTEKSPYARLRPVGLGEVKLNGGLLGERTRINHISSIPSGWNQLVENGSIGNFYVVAGKRTGEVKGFVYQDSDVHKWLEGASWALVRGDLTSPKNWVDELVEAITGAQEPDGYINTHFMGDRKSLRFTNLKRDHEIYCAGHLFQAGIAHHRVTGSSSLLNVALRFADLLVEKFGEKGTQAACGHPEAEIAMVELYRETRKEEYLKLAIRMIEARGQKPPLLDGSTYLLDHTPFRKQGDAVGHAVRALYLYSGAADIYCETGDGTLLDTLHRLWEDVYNHKVYITGGLGSRHDGEAFGEAYELPNLRAYAETCASIASFMWNWRMLQIEADGRYADVMETALYNGLLSGVSLDGLRYFYVNPLESRGNHEREPWYSCGCCPPNIHRILASLPAYIFSRERNSVFIHLYTPCELSTTLTSGQAVNIKVETVYPWNGDILIRPSEGKYTLMLRIPGWVSKAELLINGKVQDIQLQPGHYALLDREWGKGDEVILNLSMPVEMIRSNPRAEENRNSLALRRGPVVYCAEEHDLKDGGLFDIYLQSDEKAFSSRFMPDMLGGVTILEGEAIQDTVSADSRPLYIPSQNFALRKLREVPIRLIPYYAWGNRGKGGMKVWLPVLLYKG